MSQISFARAVDVDANGLSGAIGHIFLSSYRSNLQYFVHSTRDLKV